MNVNHLAAVLREDAITVGVVFKRDGSARRSKKGQTVGYGYHIEGAEVGDVRRVVVDKTVSASPSWAKDPYMKEASSLSELADVAEQLFGDQHEQRVYTYKALKTMGLSVGDSVVVDSPKNGLVVVEVVRVDDFVDINLNSDIYYKWVVQKVDLTDHNNLKAADELFQKQAETLERQMRINRMVDTLLDGFSGNEKNHFNRMVDTLNGLDVAALAGSKGTTEGE